MSGSDVTSDEHSYGPGFWVASAIGWSIVGFGLWGLFDESERTNPASLVWWMGGALVVHDLIWLPLALLVGAAVGRFVPRGGQAPVAWVLGIASMLLIVGYPFIAGKGRRDDTPSMLNRSYGTGVAVYIAIAVAIGLAWWWAATRGKASDPAE